MRKIKKTTIILLSILSIFFLVGWGKKSVELLNGTPLIDLNKAIKEAPIGNQGNTQKLEEYEMESDDIIMDSQIESVPNKESIISQEEKNVVYIIEINDTTITYDGKLCNEGDLEKKIINDCSNGAGSVRLKDDYAEANIYKRVLEILDKLHKDIGLQYVSD